MIYGSGMLRIFGRVIERQRFGVEGMKVFNDFDVKVRLSVMLAGCLALNFG